MPSVDDILSAKQSDAKKAAHKAAAKSEKILAD
jgi:hypothetical protein